eukprot:6491102-Amphidinium_carterae.1
MGCGERSCCLGWTVGRKQEAILASKCTRGLRAVGRRISVQKTSMSSVRKERTLRVPFDPLNDEAKTNPVQGSVRYEEVHKNMMSELRGLQRTTHGPYQLLEGAVTFVLVLFMALWMKRVPTFVLKKPVSESANMVRDDDESDLYEAGMRARSAGVAETNQHFEQTQESFERRHKRRGDGNCWWRAVFGKHWKQAKQTIVSAVAQKHSIKIEEASVKNAWINESMMHEVAALLGVKFVILRPRCGKVWHTQTVAPVAMRHDTCLVVKLFLEESHYDACEPRRQATQLKARLKELKTNLRSRSDVQEKNVQTASDGTPKPLKMRRTPRAGKNMTPEERDSACVRQTLWSRCAPFLFSSLGGGGKGNRATSPGSVSRMATRSEECLGAVQDNRNHNSVWNCVSDSMPLGCSADMLTRLQVRALEEIDGKGMHETNICDSSEVPRVWTSLSQWCEARAELLGGQCVHDEGLSVLDDWCAQRDMIESQRTSWHKLRQAHRKRTLEAEQALYKKVCLNGGMTSDSPTDEGDDASCTLGSNDTPEEHFETETAWDSDDHQTDQAWVRLQHLVENHPMTSATSRRGARALGMGAVCARGRGVAVHTDYQFARRVFELLQLCGFRPRALSLSLNISSGVTPHRDAGNIDTTYLTTFGGPEDELVIHDDVDGSTEHHSTWRTLCSFSADDLHSTRTAVLRRRALVFYTPRTWRNLTQGDLERLYESGFRAPRIGMHHVYDSEEEDAISLTMLGGPMRAMEGGGGDTQKGYDSYLEYQAAYNKALKRAVDVRMEIGLTRDQLKALLSLDAKLRKKLNNVETSRQGVIDAIIAVADRVQMVRAVSRSRQRDQGAGGKSGGKGASSPSPSRRTKGEGKGDSKSRKPAQQEAKASKPTDSDGKGGFGAGPAQVKVNVTWDLCPGQLSDDKGEPIPQVQDFGQNVPGAILWSPEWTPQKVPSLVNQAQFRAVPQLLITPKPDKIAGKEPTKLMLRMKQTTMIEGKPNLVKIMELPAWIHQLNEAVFTAMPQGKTLQIQNVRCPTTVLRAEVLTEDLETKVVELLTGRSQQTASQAFKELLPKPLQDAVKDIWGIKRASKRHLTLLMRIEAQMARSMESVSGVGPVWVDTEKEFRDQVEVVWLKRIVNGKPIWLEKGQVREIMSKFSHYGLVYKGEELALRVPKGTGDKVKTELDQSQGFLFHLVGLDAQLFQDDVEALLTQMQWNAKVVPGSRRCRRGEVRWSVRSAEQPPVRAYHWRATDLRLQGMMRVVDPTESKKSGASVSPSKQGIDVVGAASWSAVVQNKTASRSKDGDNPQKRAEDSKQAEQAEVEGSFDPDLGDRDDDDEAMEEDARGKRQAENDRGRKTAKQRRGQGGAIREGGSGTSEEEEAQRWGAWTMWPRQTASTQCASAGSSAGAENVVVPTVKDRMDGLEGNLTRMQGNMEMFMQQMMGTLAQLQTQQQQLMSAVGPGEQQVAPVSVIQQLHHQAQDPSTEA